MNDHDMYLKDQEDLNRIGGDARHMLTIEREGYFLREYNENLREQGFEAEVRESFYGSVESDLRRRRRLMEQLEAERVDPMCSSIEEIREEGKKQRGWPQREIDWDSVGPTFKIVKV